MALYSQRIPIRLVIRSGMERRIKLYRYENFIDKREDTSFVEGT
jgi:hypothetical protein